MGNLVLSPTDGVVNEFHVLNMSFVQEGQLIMTIGGQEVFAPSDGKVFFRVDYMQPRIETGDILAMIGFVRRSFIDTQQRKTDKSQQKQKPTS